MSLARRNPRQTAESRLSFGYGFRISEYGRFVLAGLWVASLIDSSLLPFVAWIQFAAITYWFLRGRTGVASPLGFAALYSGYVVLAPASYVILLNRPLRPFINETTVREGTIELLFGSWTAIVAGICAASLLSKRLTQEGRVRSPLAGIDPGPLDLVAARALLCLALAIRLITLVLFGSRSFLQQTSLTGINALEPAVTLALIASAILYAGGASRSGESVFRRLDWLLFLSILGASFLIGSRGELIAPIIILFLSRERITRRTIAVGAIGGLLALLSFASVEIIRADQSLSSSASGPVETIVLLPIASPTRVADHLVGADAAPRNGSTYLWSVVYSLPGPIGTAIGGPTHGTATLEYHEIIDFRGAGGLGFNLLAEPFLNFGAGAIAPFGFLTGVFVHWIAGVSARSTKLWRRSISLALAASVPALIRTDLLAVINTIVLPSILIFFVQILLRRLET